MNPIPDTFPTVSTDRMFSLFDCIGSMIIQLELLFSHQLDPERLARAFELMLDAEPILGCRFSIEGQKPLWKRAGCDGRDNFSTTTDQQRYQQFMLEPLEASVGPQLKGMLLQASSGDQLLIKIAHQAADAGGLKETTSIIASIYRELASNPDYQPKPNCSGARGPKQVMRQIPKLAYPKIVRNDFVQLRHNNHPPETLSLPMDCQHPNDLHFIQRRIPAEQVEALTLWGSKKGATLNDLMMAAHYRATASVSEWDGSAQLRLATTVDLRRYLPNKRAGGVCNISAIELSTLGTDLGDDFSATLDKVVSITRDRKENWIGLGPYVIGVPITSRLPIRWAIGQGKKIWKQTVEKKRATPVLTNLGKIDPEKVTFDQPPVSAALLPPPTYPPILTCGISGYLGSVTIAAGIYPSAMQKVSADQFFDAMVDQLPM